MDGIFDGKDIQFLQEYLVAFGCADNDETKMNDGVDCNYKDVVDKMTTS